MAHVRVLKQERLDDDDPKDYTKVTEIRRVLNYKIDTLSGDVIFWWDKDGSGSTELPVDELNLDIMADSEVHIRLSDDHKWHWSQNFDAITLKKEDKKYYGTLEYEMPNGNYEEWDGQSAKTWKTKRIKFRAALNEDNTGQNTHGFSLNIDLVLPGGKILPITLDPDIQNPKPNFVEPEGDPIPGVLSAL